MPALVNLSVEFGTVMIYTCEKSCWPDIQHPMEEFLFIQEDPDQQLFN
uniref:Programmed cell death protein 2 C-terminal domain-containing protein n=1 Tax=Sphenodon punctatus TaxID=8508 RepID=A0A8D0GXL6_SPHPU